VRALLGELNLLLVEPSSAPDIPNTGKIDFCAMVPMQAMNLLNRGKWPNIKIVIIGGAKTNPELVRKIKNIDTVIYETYGMAETCSHIALKPLNGKNADIHFSILPQVKIDTDIRGCLTIEWEILPEKLITNDYVEIISENKFKWLGRYDNIINSGGIKIQPETLETQFSEILGIPCVLIGKADPILGEQIVMILESTIKINTNSVLKKLNPLFEKKILPKSIICLNKFPRNKSFKIDRILLKKLINT
jgi:O-succinylbenzoic acid--CoA ligase